RMQNAIRVVIGLLDARREILVAVEAGRLLEDRAQHVEVMREQAILLGGLVQLGQRRNVVEGRRVALLLSKGVTNTAPALAQKEALGVLHLVAQHVEEQ